MSAIEVATLDVSVPAGTVPLHRARRRSRADGWRTTLVVGAASLISSGLWLVLLLVSLPGGRSLHRALMAWDGGWYLRVARVGYTDNPFGRRSAAFPPVYPLIERGWMDLTHLSVVGFVVVLNIVAQAAAACVLWSILGRGSASPADRVRYLTLFLVSPPVLFDLMGYASSLFVLAVFLVLWSLQRGRTWTAVGVLGVACGLNLAGLALVAGFAVSSLISAARWRQISRPEVGRLVLQAGTALTVPVAYAVYLQAQLGSWQAFYTALDRWEPPLSLGQTLDRIVTFAPARLSVTEFLRHPHGAWPSYAIDSVTLGLVLALLVGLILTRGWATYHFWSLFFIVLLAQVQAARYGEEYSFTRLVLPVAIAAGSFSPVRRILTRPWVFGVLVTLFVIGTVVYVERLSGLQWVD